jgi:DNA-binding MarR family transcriptional regulator
MRKEEENIILAFKRLIHVLTTGKKLPYEYGRTTLYRAEVHILEIIGKKSGITASDIVNDMEITKGAISQIISKLFKKGLLQKSFKADNKKIQELYLTKKGAEVLSYHDEHEKELIKKLISELRRCRTEDIEKFTTIVHSVADFIRK